MNGFKRFFLIVFSISGLLVLAALGLPWVGLWRAQATALLGNVIYLTAVEVLFGITAVGLVATLIRAIAARKNQKNILVTTVEGGQISVARDAIASQAAHIIEEDGTCTCVRVDVDARRRSNIKVKARVLPSTSVDVIAKGNELHERLAKGLAAVCGDNISSISIEFEEPEEITSTIASAPAAAPAYDPVFETVQAAASYTDYLPEPAAPASAPALAPEGTSEITLDMTTFHASDAPLPEAKTGEEA